MIKSLALQLLRVPGADAVFAPFTRARGVVFMLHRFRSPVRPLEGHDPAAVRRALAYLRRQRYRLLSLPELLRCALDGRVPDRAVTFTIDDGYFDHAEIAAPVFAEFDCPVTTFVTTGFLDGELWFWWDQIEYVFTASRRLAVEVQLGPQLLRYSFATPAERAAAQGAFTEACKQVPDEEKHAAIRRLATNAEVDLPEQAPPQYAPMSWDDLRACEKRGMSFGPHTVTHPVLSRVSDERSRWELAESWRRLRAEAAAPVPIFCYPNGRESDFSSREIRTLAQLDFLGAVVGWPGVVGSPASVAGDSAFTLRRFGFPDDLPHLIEIASGVEYAKSLLRREAI